MTLKRSFSHVGAITNSEGLLKMIKSFLEANEVERSTRIWGIINLFEEKQLKGWSDLPKTLIYHEVFEIFEIISTLGHICPKMILEAISKDHVNELSGKNQKGRNTQFELFIASKYIQAGYNVQFGEPDLFFYYLGNRYNIACKRPQSKSKVLNNIKKASKQISLHDGFGIVALDLTPTSVRNFDWNSDLSVVIKSGQDLIWKNFLSSNRRRINELVGKRVSIVHVYGGLNLKVKNNYVYSLFDYALEIKSNRTENDYFHEIINKVQSVHPCRIS